MANVPDICFDYFLSTVTSVELREVMSLPILPNYTGTHAIKIAMHVHQSCPLGQW